MDEELTHQVVLIDTQGISGLRVTQVLMEVFGYNTDLAWKIVDDVESSNLDIVPCFNGSKEICDDKAITLMEMGVPCTVSEI